jgi:hypothetical protein
MLSSSDSLLLTSDFPLPTAPLRHCVTALGGGKPLPYILTPHFSHPTASLRREGSSPSPTFSLPTSHFPPRHRVTASLPDGRHRGTAASDLTAHFPPLSTFEPGCHPKVQPPTSITARSISRCLEIDFIPITMSRPSLVRLRHSFWPFLAKQRQDPCPESLGQRARADLTKPQHRYLDENSADDADSPGTPSAFEMSDRQSLDGPRPPQEFRSTRRWRSGSFRPWHLQNRERRPADPETRS